jgi:hypothetical protein
MTNGLSFGRDHIIATAEFNHRDRWRGLACDLSRSVAETSLRHEKIIGCPATRVPITRPGRFLPLMNGAIAP